MQLNPILADLALKLLKSRPKCRQEGVACEKHSYHLGIMHRNRAAACPADGYAMNF